VTALDWAIVVFALLMAVVGWRQGFVLGALSLAGFVVGAVLGTRLGPELLPEGSESPYGPLFGLFGAAVGGAIMATGLEGVGSALRRRLTFPILATVDGTLGAALAAVLALGMAWIGGAVALHTPGARGLREDIQRSEILRRLNDVLPPSGPILNALARFDPFPRINGPEANVPAPPSRAAIARDPDVQAAAASVVKVLGTACGLGVEGSGWVAGAGVVVTNAHVVAGQDDTTVQLRGEGPRLDATAIAFDPRNDVAVLRVSGLEAPVLEMAEPRSGERAAILGFPRNGPYDVRGARVGPTRLVISRDAYGNGPVQRLMTSFRGLVRPGNSGGPVVDAEGDVAATVFAASTGDGPRGGYGVPNSVVRRELAEASGPVGTGPCAG
jgi:hypothetical protein